MRIALIAAVAGFSAAGVARARLGPAAIDPQAYESIAQANHRAVVRIDTVEYFPSQIVEDARDVNDASSYVGLAGKSVWFALTLPFKALWQGVVYATDPIEPPAERGVGSGFIIDPTGQVLTANHVVEGANEITVDVPEVGEFPAIVAGEDRNTDLAVIQLATNTPIVFDTVKLGDSDPLKPGQFVLAIGHPLGLQQSVSSGVVSAVGLLQDDDSKDDLIQHDAGINPGSSGGPLLDLNSEVVGINASIAADGQAVGFAIPINVARNELDDLRTGVPHQQPYIGVDFDPITVKSMHENKLLSTAGVLVTAVEKHGPAQVAGVNEDDVIVSVGNKKVTSQEDFYRAISRSRIGEKLKLEVLRDGADGDLEVTPVARPRVRSFW